MANIKITDLTAYADPASTDVLPIVDVGADVTKKVSVGDLLENAGSGTEALPGIAFDGDPDTGIYRPGDDQLAISTNGAQRLFIDANGNIEAKNQRFYVDNTNGRVGILTSSPQKTLEVAAANDPTLRFNDLRGYTTDLKQGGSIFSIINNDPSGSISLGTNVSESFRITSDGKVGLGTSSPSALFHSVATSAGAATVAAAIQNRSLTIGTEVRLALSPNTAIITDQRYAYVGSINETGSTSVSLTFGTGAGADPTERLRITSTGVLQIADAGDIAVGTTTGTKIGTATSQKIGFYNATPVVQPTTGVAEAAFVENSGGTAVNVDSTFGGYTIQQVVEALQTLGLLA